VGSDGIGESMANPSDRGAIQKGIPAAPLRSPKS